MSVGCDDARNQFRRNAVARKHLAREAALPVRPSEVGDVETRDEVWSALHALPLRQREVLVCRFFMDLSERERPNSCDARPAP